MPHGGAGIGMPLQGTGGVGGGGGILGFSLIIDAESPESRIMFTGLIAASAYWLLTVNLPLFLPGSWSDGLALSMYSSSTSKMVEGCLP